MDGDRVINNEKGNGKPLSKWILKTFLKIALIPLVLVELAFIGIYFFVNGYAYSETRDYFELETQEEVQEYAQYEATSIQNQLNGVANATELYRQQVKRAFQQTDAAVVIKPENETRLQTTSDGALYTETNSNQDGAAVYYSGIVPIGEKEELKVHKLLAVEDVMQDIYHSQPLANALYINTYDSLNVIYPYFNVIEQYPRLMDIPSYNFYYEADKKNNPEKELVWTDAYLDPAGNEWMTSAIAPVYNDNDLEAVVGIDITLNTIVDQVLDLQLPWRGYGILVSDDGTILAMPEQAEKTFDIIELKDHTYQEAIEKDTFKPEDFNIHNQTELDQLTTEMNRDETGTTSLLVANKQHFVSWTSIENTEWSLLLFVPETNVFADFDQLSEGLAHVGLFTFAGLVLFYLLFFLYIYKQSNKMSSTIHSPLIQINSMAKEIGKGNYYQPTPAIKIIEIQETSDAIVEMGDQLGIKNDALLVAETELRQRESDLHSLVNSIEDVIFILDDKGTFLNVWLNDESKLFLPKEQLIGLTISAILSGDDLEMFTNNLEDVFNTGKATVLELFVPTPKGEGGTWLQGRMSPIIVDEQNNFESVSLSARDITEIKAMEKSLINAKEQAERSNLAKSEFLSSMSHELRTPLNAIIGFSQLLELDDNEPLTADQQENVSDILNAGNHLLSLINDILDLAKIESGKLSISMEPINITSILQDVIGITTPIAAKQNITIVNNTQNDDSLFVKADRTRLKQILLNLITNAIKYNKENGFVFIDFKQKDEHIEISITDTGIGISDAEIAYIFEPFLRLNEDNKYIEGTGIGLSVAKELVELLNGTIHVNSEKGQGATFWIELPIHTHNKDDYEQIDDLVGLSSYDNDKHACMHRILYIEDNLANVRLVDSILVKFPYTELFFATDGKKGLDLAETIVPDLILLDIHLPDMDGYQVLTELKNKTLTKETPVIAISANAMSSDLEKARHAGFIDYMTKPIDVNNFIKTIHDVLDIDMED